VGSVGMLIAPPLAGCDGAELVKTGRLIKKSANIGSGDRERGVQAREIYLDILAVTFSLVGILGTDCDPY